MSRQNNVWKWKGEIFFSKIIKDMSHFTSNPLRS